MSGVRTALARRPVKVGLGLLVAGLVLGGVALDGTNGVSAGELEVTSILTAFPDGRIVVEDGTATYGLVGAMDLSPYIGKVGVVAGGIGDGILYVRSLTVGAIRVEEQQGVAKFMGTGLVEQTPDGYQTTIQGIVFTLLGTDQLAQVVGQTVQIEGDMTGTWVTVTALRTADGQGIPI